MTLRILKGSCLRSDLPSLEGILGLSLVIKKRRVMIKVLLGGILGVIATVALEAAAIWVLFIRGK